MIYNLVKGYFFAKEEEVGSFDSRYEGGTILEIIVTLLSGILGVSSSIVYEVISTILKRKNSNFSESLSQRSVLKN